MRTAGTQLAPDFHLSLLSAARPGVASRGEACGRARGGWPRRRWRRRWSAAGGGGVRRWWRCGGGERWDTAAVESQQLLLKNCHGSQSPMDTGLQSACLACGHEADMGQSPSARARDTVMSSHVTIVALQAVPCSSCIDKIIALVGRKSFLGLTPPAALPRSAHHTQDC